MKTMQKNARKKVLFTIHTLGGGGAEQVLINLANNLNPKKYDVTVMTIIDTGELRHELSPHIRYKTTIPLGRNSHGRISNRSGSLLSKNSRGKTIATKIYVFFWKYFPVSILYKLFVRDKYDVEIAFLEGISAKFIANSSNPKSKKYAWIHVDLERQSKSSKVFKNYSEERQTYDIFDQVICVSEDVRRKFIKKYHIRPSKVITRYNPIDAREILGKANRSPKLVKNGLVITSIGRLNHQKGYDRLLKVAKRLIDEGEQFSLQIIGEGTSKENLEKYIQAHHLEKNIKLLGFKSNPYIHLKQSDVYVCSSRTEGFSTAVSEAIILGLPVVTTTCAGMKEILGSNNMYGIITKNSEDGLYNGLKKMIKSKRARMHYAKKAILRRQIFELESAVAKIEELIDA